MLWHCTMHLHPRATSAHQLTGLVAACVRTSSLMCHLHCVHRVMDCLAANLGFGEDVCWGQSCSCPALNVVPAEGSITQGTALGHG